MSGVIIDPFALQKQLNPSKPAAQAAPAVSAADAAKAAEAARRTQFDMLHPARYSKAGGTILTLGGGSDDLKKTLGA